MKVYVYPDEDGWAAFRLRITAIERLGYRCEHWRSDASSYIEVTG